MKFKSIAMTGMLSLAGLGLVGAGAHAAFTTSTTSNQPIATGAPGVTLSGSCVSGTNCPGAPSDLYSLSNNGATLTFTSGAPSGSTFTTGDEQVTATNTGDIPLTELILNIVSTYPGSQLATEASMCVTSTGIGTSGGDYVLYNGPLSGGLNANWSQGGDTLTVAGTPATSSSAPTDNYIINLYAGSEQTQCGTSFTSGTGAASGTGTTVAPGSVVTPGISTASPLNSDAESESIVISTTMTYSG